MKPVVKLLINRHNNKYSYTGASDDNLLKNIELFDKLSLRFSNRVLFIKDVIGSNEICCWSFYGHGKRIAEVSSLRKSPFLLGRIDYIAKYIVITYIQTYVNDLYILGFRSVVLQLSMLLIAKIPR